MLSKIKDSEDEHFAQSSIYALVRGEEKASSLKAWGYTPLLFDGLDAVDQLKAIASDFDG